MSLTFVHGAIRPFFDRIAAFDILPNNALVDLKTIMALSCRSKSSVYRDIAAGRLAKSVRIGSQAVRWRVGDVREYLTGETK